jgi:L-2,4-diaminobutyrate decarboxylase
MNLELDKHFLNTSTESKNIYMDSMQKSLSNVSECIKQNNVYSGKSIPILKKESGGFDIGIESESMNVLLDNQLKIFLENSININSPKSIAHLHCPVMLPSLVAELHISAMNQSMDSWDQSPIATYIEQNTIDWLSSLIYTSKNIADGVFTSGGTQSNLMGLLLARDNYCKNILHHDTANKGLPIEANKFRVLCTSKTHFSIHKSLSLLGLGMNCIEIIDTDEHLQLDTVDLLIKIQNLIANDLIPICIVTTAGDTDFGCIDNIEEIARISKEHDIWLHVDAAVGGALLLSDNNKFRLNGIDQADSVTIDFHKLFFQPISCGAFFCKDKSVFNLINYNADYLNTDQGGFDALNLVDKSIQTTRRFDALKLSISLKCCGTKLLGNWIDHIIKTTTESIKLINSSNHFDLAFQENQHLNNSLNTVVFRFNDKKISDDDLNIINNNIHKNIFLSNKFAIAQTKVRNIVFLKMTFVNPMITMDLIKECLDEIRKQAYLINNQKMENKHD